MSDLADTDLTEKDAVAPKLFLERLLALALLLILSPVVLIVALWVGFSLGRPLIFVQQRIGINRQPFDMFKFRSLNNRRDAMGKLLPDKQRMVASSSFLRRSRLDELPQLWCIFKGDMSFVGPRPLLPQTITQLGDLGVHRCSVRPGMTGWSQICGNTFLDDDTKLALDIWYIDHSSIWLDLRILLSTFVTLLFGERISRPHIDQAMTYVARRYDFSFATHLDGS